MFFLGFQPLIFWDVTASNFWPLKNVAKRPPEKGKVVIFRSCLEFFQGQVVVVRLSLGQESNFHTPKSWVITLKSWMITPKSWVITPKSRVITPTSWVITLTSWVITPVKPIYFGPCIGARYKSIYNWSCRIVFGEDLLIVPFNRWVEKGCCNYRFVVIF